MIPQLYFDKIVKFFDGSTAKAWIWFTTPNSGLSGVTPLNMIKIGRAVKLKKFIDDMLDENKRYYS